MSDDKRIEEILARHNDAEWRYYELPSQMHEDRATLLAEVDRLHADLATQQGCCDGAAAQDAHVRRERIATAALNGLFVNATVAYTPAQFALAAVVMADALIAELDKEEEGKP